MSTGAAPDIRAQTRSAIAVIEGRLREVDSRLADLVKLVVHYVQDDVSEPDLETALGASLGRGVQVVVTLVPLRALPLSGQRVLISALAMRARDREAVTLAALPEPGPGCCHGLRCGPFTFTSGQSAGSRHERVLYPGDLVAQNRRTIDNLLAILAALEVPVSSIVKGNSWRADAPSDAAYLAAARDRFEFFGAAHAAVTGITVPGLAPLGHLNRLDVWALDADLPRRRHLPDDHWDWKIETPYSHGLQAGPWLFVGGQAALDRRCNVQQPGNLVAQTDITMSFVERVLRTAGFGFADVVKSDVYYCPADDTDARASLERTFARHFGAARPATATVPVDALAYPLQVVEVEAVAHREVR